MAGFLSYDGEYRFPLVLAQGSQVSMRVARGSASWLSSHGRVHDTGCLGLVLWDDPEGCYGGEEGGGFRMGSTCIPEADSF